MIQSKRDLKYYLECDKIAMGKKRRAMPWNDTYYFLYVYRNYEYWYNNKDNFWGRMVAIFWHVKFKKISMKCGFSIPINCIGPGLALPHYGTIIISNNVIIGENCKIHAGTNIGATGGKEEAKTIGNNVYIGPGAKIVGGGIIANNVVVGANAVVIGSIEEEGITVGGIPAKKISDNDSSMHLIKATQIIK